MTPQWLPWLIVLFVVVEAGWMTVDGSYALVTGDYITPGNGQYAGSLGPWADVVDRVGIDPRSTTMKAIFVTYGLTWLVVAVMFIIGVQGVWFARLLFALGSLWYLPIGTILGVSQAVLLLWIYSPIPLK